MTSVLLIYPFFKPRIDRSVFRFPPLGIAYIAASLRNAGHAVQILDCTFMNKADALNRALSMKSDVIGIYCMATMLQDCVWFAENLRNQCRLLVAGGPLPTCEPVSFLNYFDVVVCGEGEKTINEIVSAFHLGSDMSNIKGIIYHEKSSQQNAGESIPIFTPERPFLKDLDSIPFPARDLLPNDDYIKYARNKYGYSITTVMSTRGCPFECDFCSNVVFGGSYRERSAVNVVDEIEEALRWRYDRISFADDVFTLNKQRVSEICSEIVNRKIHFQWECLGRVDMLDYSMALEMKNAGCSRVYFGIELGNNKILKIMNKKITIESARTAVEAAHHAGLEVGAFFIIFYPGETSDTILDTLHFANSLPIDYMGLTIPYPLPGTALYERVKNRTKLNWQPENNILFSHTLTFDADFSRTKIWFGLLKGQIQFKLKKKLRGAAPILINLFEKFTDGIFRILT